jgi:hypothetical protein
MADIRARALCSRVADETVIPIFLDKTKFPRIPRDLLGIHFQFDVNDPDWKAKADVEIIYKLIDKLSE